MNHDSHLDDPLATALRSAAREREPARDLWPEISGRIRRRQRQRARTVVGVGAFLAAAGFTLLLGPLGGRGPLARSTAGSGGHAEGPATSQLAQVSSGGMGGNGAGGSGGMAASRSGGARLEASAGSGPPATWR